MSIIDTTKLCPVCGKMPTFSPSMTRDAENVGCNWEDHCPKEGSFDFTFGYLPMPEAIEKWNEAVDNWVKT